MWYKQSKFKPKKKTQKKNPNKKNIRGRAPNTLARSWIRLCICIYTTAFRVGNRKHHCMHRKQFNFSLESLHLNYSSFTSSWDYIQVRWKRRNNVRYENTLWCERIIYMKAWRLILSYLILFESYREIHYQGWETFYVNRPLLIPIDFVLTLLIKKYISTNLLIALQVLFKTKN